MYQGGGSYANPAIPIDPRWAEMRHDGRAYMRAQRILRRLTHADYRLVRTPQSHFLATHGILARRIAHTSPRIQRFQAKEMSNEY